MSECRRNSFWPTPFRLPWFQPFPFRTQLLRYTANPSPAQMGGDLIDLIESGGSLLVYVADVSGHGLAAGQLMGMLKTAMRVSLQFQQHPVALLEVADRVLPAVKEPDMYATLALLHFDGSAHAEYALAGHVPILHYRDRSRARPGSRCSNFLWG